MSRIAMRRSDVPRRPRRPVATRGRLVASLAAATVLAGCGMTHPVAAPSSSAQLSSTSAASTGSAGTTPGTSPFLSTVGSSTPLVTASTSTVVTAASSTTKQQQVIRIATDLPSADQFGDSERDGSQLAIDDATRQGLLPGDQVSLVSEPGPQGVRSAIADPSVLGVIGPVTSAEAAADLPAGSPAALAIISPSAGDQPAGSLPFFRLAVTGGAQGAALADFAAKARGLHTAYIVDDAQPDGQALTAGFSDEWRLLGGHISGHASVPAGTSSYLNLLTQIAAEQPDLILYGGADATDALTLRQQMLQIPGLKNTLFIGGDRSHAATFAKAIGPSNLTYTATAGPDGSDDPQFRTEFVNRFGTGVIGTYSAAAYDATMILLHAIQTAGTHGTITRAAVIAAVAATNYPGTGATWSFDDTGGPVLHVVTIYTPAAATVTEGDGWSFVARICPNC